MPLIFICKIIIRGDYKKIFASLFWLGAFDFGSISGLEKRRRYFLSLVCFVVLVLHFMSYTLSLDWDVILISMLGWLNNTVVYFT